MINYHKHILDNGLTLLIEQDKSTSMSAINVLYKVGSKDENPTKTGFAHLFEHLMFGGSDHAPNFDEPLQRAGGDNNAFTNSDYTNFYDTVPVQNIETALWLEADRMAFLTLNQQSLDVQKKVVTEEFKEVCLNKPYGDAWHHMSDLCYKEHPYKWPTIGLDISHISQANLDDVAQFYSKYYHPSNAILSISSPLDHKRIIDLAQHWFGDIKSQIINKSNTHIEPLQTQIRHKTIIGQIPTPLIIMAFHMPGRTSQDYYACDLISDILANGKSARFYQNLIKDKQIFSDIDCYISGSFDTGLIIIEGRPMPQVAIDTAVDHVWEEINELKQSSIIERELQKLKNKVISSLCLSDLTVLNKSMSMAYFEYLDQIELMNKQEELYEAVSAYDIHKAANQYLNEDNLNMLYYLPSENNNDKIYRG